MIPGRFPPGLAGPAFLLAASLLVAFPHGAFSALTEAQARGKRIYAEGKGRGPIFAFLMAPGIKAPGTGFPCVKCHREDGSGQREGGVRSAEITWFILTKEYRGVRPSGRDHPPYDDESLRAAITGGLDPAGNELHEAHPRYEMESGDLDDIVAYLEILGREPVPGITDNEVRVGILLPGKGPLAGAGKEVGALLTEYFAEVNGRGGGLHRRTLSLVPFRFDPARKGAAAEAVRGPVEREEIFCFLANLGVPPGDEAERLLASSKVPVIVPLLVAPEGGFGTFRYTFHVLASIRDQARVMVDFLAEGLPEPASRLFLLYAKDGYGEGGAAGAREQAAKHRVSLVAEVPFPPGGLDAAGAMARLKGGSADAVLFFGGGADALAFLREAGSGRFSPLFLAPATMVGESLSLLPPGLAERVYLASPFSSPGEGAQGMTDFFRLEQKSKGGKAHRSLTLLAFTGARLLEEGLRRTGRAVTREGFVDTVGALYEFRTGVTPPLTFNENRRVGAPGAAILRVDTRNRRLVPAAAWKEPK